MSRCSKVKCNNKQQLANSSLTNQAGQLAGSPLADPSKNPAQGEEGGIEAGWRRRRSPEAPRKSKPILRKLKVDLGVAGNPEKYAQ